LFQPTFEHRALSVSWMLPVLKGGVATTLALPAPLV